MNTYSIPTSRCDAKRHSAFTLVEVLVAVAIMSLLFAVILVPLRLGFETFHIGTARSELQQQAQLTLQQIGNDLRRAQFVFPNSRVIGVSDNPNSASPCASASYRSHTSWNYQPYIKSTVSSETDSPTSPAANQTYGICSTLGIESWSNPSRIEMLQVRRNDSGAEASSKAGQDFIISYYPRRLDITQIYDAIDNPIVLFRAQIPFRNRVAADQSPGTDYTVDSATPPNKNVETDWTKYPATIGGTCDATLGQSDRNFLWITHNFYGEADLEPLSTDTPAATGMTTVVAGAHTLATPRGMGLISPRASTTNSGAYVPELSFVQEATNGGRIDRVTVHMSLAQFDQGGAGSANGEGRAQRVRVSQTFDLPNAGCSP